MAKKNSSGQNSSQGRAEKHSPLRLLWSNDSPQVALEKWWHFLHRVILVQLVCSVLMQVSYVAFPSYNFALALWSLVCCTPKWFNKNPRLTLLFIGALAFSIATDMIWMSLWVSGNVFYDQFCGQNGVSIISCGGASDYFPGCTTNRFSLFALLMNVLAKLSGMFAVYRIRSLTLSQKKHAGGSSSTPAEVNPLPTGAHDAAMEASSVGTSGGSG
ncbi:hypothetical protein Poli38472_002905 [Pythium oligandrum]|uniref:Uncharacterized protein n=1 Tax=Pythium oligandrum TaxID=41045 RepID=A0A8K1C5T6_PYTOL|nr:hypothetical protein Poli38472_002905 [Pythium oligandrum]|eukprot:TMW56980.1 hypothetical protein Poli38472_002905 [Pythium oligandrum]